MRPRIIISNAVALNGALTGFPVDFAVYYPTLLSYHPCAVLAGADTVLKAPLELGPESEEDRRARPLIPGETRPYWVVVDSRGRLPGILHAFRSMEYIREIIVCISARTPESYRRYLVEREYPVIEAGEDHVDLTVLVRELWEKFSVRVLVTDTGGTLTTAFLQANLVDELSIVLSPYLSPYTEILLFRPPIGSGKPIALALKSSEVLAEDYIHIRYDVLQ